MANDGGNQEDTASILLVRIHTQSEEIDHKVFMAKDTITIGRDPYMDLYLEDPTVSRLHAVIEREAQGRMIIRDRSSNGMAVNGETVKLHTLQDKDEISIGRFRLVLEFFDDGKSALNERALAEGWTIDDDRTLRAPAPGWQKRESTETD